MAAFPYRAARHIVERLFAKGEAWWGENLARVSSPVRERACVLDRYRSCSKGPLVEEGMRPLWGYGLRWRCATGIVRASVATDLLRRGGTFLTGERTGKMNGAKGTEVGEGGGHL